MINLVIHQKDGDVVSFEGRMVPPGEVVLEEGDLAAIVLSEADVSHLKKVLSHPNFLVDSAPLEGRAAIVSREIRESRATGHSYGLFKLRFSSIVYVPVVPNSPFHRAFESALQREFNVLKGSIEELSQIEFEVDLQVSSLETYSPFLRVRGVRALVPGRKLL